MRDGSGGFFITGKTPRNRSPRKILLSWFVERRTPSNVPKIEECKFLPRSSQVDGGCGSKTEDKTEELTPDEYEREGSSEYSFHPGNVRTTRNDGNKIVGILWRK